MDVFVGSLHTWYDIVDGNTFYPVYTWPDGMEHYWRCSNLGYSHRVYIAAFAFLNGLDINLLIDALYGVNFMMNLSKEIKFRDLYVYWSNIVDGYNRRSRYFTYCFYHNRICDLNHNLYRLRNNGQSQPTSTRGGGGGHRPGRISAWHC